MATNPIDDFLGYTNRATNATIRKAALQQGISQFSSFAMRDILASASKQAAGEVANTLAIFSRTLGGSITRLRETRIKTLLTPAGERANQAVVNTYQQRRHGPSGYRQGQRDSGGKLIRALSSPNMYRVARDGIDYINPVWLDSQARQWYRMNFGAGRRGRDTTKPVNYRMKFLGQDTGISFSLQGRPSPSFYIPGGVWGQMSGNSMINIVPWDASRRGQDAFNPNTAAAGKRVNTGPGRREASSFLASPSVIHRTSQLSRGIRGSRFLDAGVRSLARDIPVAYSKLFDEWLKESEGGIGPLVTVAADRVSIATARELIDAQLARFSRSPTVRGLI